MKAAIDRIEDGDVVVLVPAAGESADWTEFAIPLSYLPGAYEGEIIVLELIRAEGAHEVAQAAAPGVSPASPAPFTVGQRVRYAHPSWGDVIGEILSLDGNPGNVLVQDLSKHGAREWWPVAALVPA